MTDEAELFGCLHIGGQIIDEDRPGRVEVESVPGQFEDRRIGFDQPDFTRDDDVFEFADCRGDDGAWWMVSADQFESPSRRTPAVLRSATISAMPSI